MTKQITIKVEVEERWIPYFLSMLKYMQYLGGIGSSRKVCLFSDGDGDFRPKFEFNVDYEKKEPIKNDDGNVLYDAG